MTYSLTFITDAAARTDATCESCGGAGSLHVNRRGWYRTLCTLCAAEHEQDYQTYTLTWYPLGAEPVTAALRDITPDALLDAAADADMPCSWFSDSFLYRTLYALSYQLLVGNDAEVSLPEGMLVVVPRAL